MRTSAGLTSCWLLAAAIGGCGAFADAVDGGDGGPDGGLDQLVFAPDSPSLYQGQRRDFIISFKGDPPWVGSDGGQLFVTGFEFVNANDRSEVLDDIQSIRRSEGPKSVSATLLADDDADVSKVRLLLLEMAYSQFGQPQQLHAGEAYFWVYPRPQGQTTDGGSDAGDGGDR